MIENRPPNVPQLYASQALHARYALHARIFLLGGFVSVENKECLIYFPNLIRRGKSGSQFDKVSETAAFH